MCNALTIRLATFDQRNASRDLIDLTNRYMQPPGSHRAFARTLTADVGPLGVKDRDSFVRLACSLKRPVLVMWGKQDRVFPSHHGERAMASLPQAELELIDGCGHYPQWEQPDAFVAVVGRHLGAS
jgi:pimeloyl-ACP methyl ester carboxylesterase